MTFGKSECTLHRISTSSSSRVLVTIYTVGFTKKTAQEFFDLLRESGAPHLLDIRFNNTSQLAAFTKRDDLSYFLMQLLGMQYHELPVLAPTETMVKELRRTGDWAKYEREYLALLEQRQARRHVDSRLLEEGAVLLCSEASHRYCHRRLAAEYLAAAMTEPVQIMHL